MSFKIDIHPSDTLRIVCSGLVNSEELSSIRENAMAIVRTNELKHICCDLRNAIIDVRKFDILSYTESSKRVYRSITRTAIIYSTGKHNMKELSMYATLANSKGFKVKLFNNKSEALKWLKF
jgi:hypothetical protein